MSTYQQPQQLHPYNGYAQYAQSAYASPDLQSGQVPFPQGPPGHTPLPRPKKFSRNTNTNGFGDQPPLKSAMKRTSSSRNEPVSSRSRPVSHSRREGDRRRVPEQPNGIRPVESTPSRREGRSISRQRTNSRIAFIPDHIFVSFRRDNELNITNIVEEVALGKLAEAISNMWPDGHDMETRRHKWRVVFHGSPWTSSTNSDKGLAARLIIRNIFAALASLGFSYTSITNSSKFSPSSLMFSRVPLELYNTLTTEFFILSISRNQRRFTFVHAPESIVRNLAVDLKQYFPYQLASDRLAEHGMLVLKIRDRIHGAPPLDRHMFIAWTLQYISRKGFSFEAVVPLERRTFSFGLGGKKELWVFRRKGQLGI